MPLKTRAMGSLLLYPWRLEGAVVRAVPAKGCRPMVKIIPWVKHTGTKEKLGIYSLFFLFFFSSMKSNQISRIWASENEDLSHISKCSGKLFSTIQISFEPPSSIILSNWKFFFLGKKKSLMQAGLKALSLFGHPMGLSKLPCDEFVGYIPVKQTKLNNVITCGRIHFGLCRTQSFEKGIWGLKPQPGLQIHSSSCSWIQTAL